MYGFSAGFSTDVSTGFSNLPSMSPMAAQLQMKRKVNDRYFKISSYTRAAIANGKKFESCVIQGSKIEQIMGEFLMLFRLLFIDERAVCEY